MLELLQLAHTMYWQHGARPALVMALDFKGVVSKVIGLEGKKIFLKFDFKAGLFKANLINSLPNHKDALLLLNLMQKRA